MRSQNKQPLQTKLLSNNKGKGTDRERETDINNYNNTDSPASHQHNQMRSNPIHTPPNLPSGTVVLGQSDKRKLSMIAQIQGLSNPTISARRYRMAQVFLTSPPHNYRCTVFAMLFVCFFGSLGLPPNYYHASHCSRGTTRSQQQQLLSKSSLSLSLSVINTCELF